MSIQPEPDDLLIAICYGCENGMRAGGNPEYPVHYLPGKMQGPPSPCWNTDEYLGEGNGWITCEGCDYRTPPENIENFSGSQFCDECVAEHDIGPGDDDYYDEEHFRDVEFANPGGNSALRAASEDNPRNLPCPQCGGEDLLTPADRARGYCCDSCADRNEGTYRGGDY